MTKKHGGKSIKFQPYKKRTPDMPFKDRMEDVKTFFTSRPGKEWLERKRFSGRDLGTISLDDYSPPTSPVRVQCSDGTSRQATPDEINDWKSECPGDFKKRQVHMRIGYGNALIEGGIKYKVAWAKAFAKYPNPENWDVGRSGDTFSKPRYLYTPTKQDKSTQTETSSLDTINEVLYESD